MWQIRGVSDETIGLVKDRAEARGLTIGQYLDWHFRQEVDHVDSRPRFQKTKTLRNEISIDAYNALVRKAKAEGYGLSKWLEKLAED